MNDTSGGMFIDKPRSLYVHIPFCRSICPYCDFPKVLLSTGFNKDYVSALLKEDERYRGYGFDTIFLGGGTPSALGGEQLKELLGELTKRHGRPKEMTVECNPEDVDLPFAKALREAGVNRVSLGVQTVDDGYLRKLGRNHTFAKALQAVGFLHEVGIDNLSADFIYALPGQTIADVKKDLDGVDQFRYLTHVSFYSLQVEKHTMFYIQGVKTPDSDTLADMYELINRELARKGFLRYEVSNFAKPGYECQHNLCYWHDDPYAAIGMGATSYENGVREVRNRDIVSYMKGAYVLRREAENAQTREFNFLMLNLRLAKGFALSEFTRRFHKDFLVSYAANIAKVSQSLIVDRQRVRVKPEYLYVLDEVLVDLLNFNGVK